MDGDDKNQALWMEEDNIEEFIEPGAETLEDIFKN